MLRIITIILLILFNINESGAETKSPNHIAISTGLSQYIPSGPMNHFNQDGSLFFQTQSSGNLLGVNVSLSYYHYIQRFILGASLSSNFILDKTTVIRINSGENTINDRSLVGLLFKSGYQICPQVTFYVLLGLKYGHFKLSDTFGSGTTSINQWTPGADMGFGAWYVASKHFLINVQYEYITFQNINFQFGSINNPGSATYQPESNLLSIGIDYLI